MKEARQKISHVMIPCYIKFKITPISILAWGVKTMVTCEKKEGVKRWWIQKQITKKKIKYLTSVFSMRQLLKMWEIWKIN